MADIFVSYSRKDEAQVKQLVRILERMRHTVHYDQDHAGGQVWWDAILQDIRASKLFILALSYDYLDSYPCSLEHAYATALGKLILPVMVSQVDFSKLPMSIARVNVVKFTQTPEEEQLLDLSGAITGLDMQPTPLLPNPLPTPPDAPISRVSILLEQITDRRDELTSAQQEALTNELLDLYLKSDSSENARFVLEKLRQRPELHAQFSDRIDRFLALSPRELRTKSPQQGPRAGHQPTRTIRIGRILTSITLLAVLVILVGLLVNNTFRSGSPTLTGQPTLLTPVAQVATSTANPTASLRLTDTPFGNTAGVSPTHPPSSALTPTLIQAGTALTPTVYARQTIKDVSFVWVPAGCFLMGSDPAKDYDAQQNEQPQHQVCITHGYWIGEFDVTNAQFDAYMKAVGKTHDVWDACRQASSEPDQPVVCVSWEDAAQYAVSLGGRLPTEAEWEYAARGPQSTIYPWSNAFNNRNANTSVGQAGKTTRVGNYPTGLSWVGAQDMAGNVRQWTADLYGEGYYQNSPPNDPYGPTSGLNRVARGGSWYDHFSSARAACRSNFDPDFQNEGLGFRVAISESSS